MSIEMGKVVDGGCWWLHMFGGVRVLGGHNRTSTDMAMSYC